MIEVRCWWLICHVGKELGYTTYADWYDISYEDVIKSGGAGLIRNYSDSPSKLVSSIYSDYKWKMWNFHTTPEHFWNEMENQKNFIDWLGIQRIHNEN